MLHPELNSVDWLNDGEKYALIGLSVKTEGEVLSDNITPELWVLNGAEFEIPSHWQEWLGSIRSREIEGCNLFLLSKLASLKPDVLDAENQLLGQRVQHFYTGLLLTSTFAPAHKPVVLTGSRREGETDIRQEWDLDPSVSSVFRGYPPIVADDIQSAALLGKKLEVLATTPPADGPWRLLRILHIYTRTRTIGEILERLHQYCRCIEGLILPSAGRTRQQFKSRTELLIGPYHHDMMGALYDIRSAVEHLHENRYLETFDRETRLDLVQKEAIVEHIARKSVARVVGNEALWPHFANTSALGKFWSLPPEERQRIWGDVIDPMDAIADFDPGLVHNGRLGAR
jgi:hypothetical protein